ncbi:MAG: nitroreductase family protein [Candidatus Bathyarchaeota archaeon]
MNNPILKNIKNRRNNIRFESTPINEEKLNAVLESGRWAPSWTNSQPWKFIVIKDKDTKEKLSVVSSSFFALSIREAPVCIAVCVNPKKDPFHFIEDGTTATQNMTLAAQSIGLGTAWIGVFSLNNERESTERKMKEILKIPKDWRLISILPLGVAKFKETKTRVNLSNIVDTNSFKSREEEKKKEEIKEIKSSESSKILPSSAREIEPSLV